LSSKTEAQKIPRRRTATITSGKVIAAVVLFIWTLIRFFEAEN
jgi:hypothetical protein